MVNESRKLTPHGSVRGAYSHLLPQYTEIVDYYLENEQRNSHLSIGTILRRADIGCTFFLYLQNGSLFSLSDIKEEDVVSDSTISNCRAEDWDIILIAPVEIG